MIEMRGMLYRKPRVHSTFKRYQVVVAHGQLMLFNYLHWQATGGPRQHIHHSKHTVLSLQDCYVFSGMITEGDLLNKTGDNFDRQTSGRHALPRRYQDGWSSQDEEAALCFVIWTGRRRVVLTQSEKKDAFDKKSVSRLGIPGKSMIFMARCRQERDMWVQQIALEIERTAASNLGGA